LKKTSPLKHILKTSLPAVVDLASEVLHADVHAKLRVQVESSTPIEVPAVPETRPAGPADGKGGRPVRERRPVVAEVKAPAAKDVKPARARSERPEKTKA